MTYVIIEMRNQRDYTQNIRAVRRDPSAVESFSFHAGLPSVLSSDKSSLVGEVMIPPCKADAVGRSLLTRREETGQRRFFSTFNLKMNAPVKPDHIQDGGNGRFCSREYFPTQTRAVRCVTTQKRMVDNSLLDSHTAKKLTDAPI